VNVEDISITKVPESEASLTFEGEGQFTEYQLEPDGLMFSEEVMFNVTLNNAYDTIPLVLQITEDSVEIVDSVQVEIDLETDTVVVSAPLSHFSNFVVGVGPVGIMHFMFRAIAEDTMIGNSVPAKAYFNIDDDTRSFIAVRPGLKTTIHRQWIEDVKIRGTVYPGTGGKLSPQDVIEGRPPDTAIAPGSSFTIPSKDFECAKLGKDSIRFLLSVDYSFRTSIWDYDSGDLIVDGTKEPPRKTHMTIRVKTQLFKCIEMPPVFDSWYPGQEWDYDYDALGKMDREYILNDLPDRFRIPAYAVVIDGRAYYFPFHETQWTTYDPHDVLCPNYHYHGEFGYAFDIDSKYEKGYKLALKQEPPPPEEDHPGCGWGSVNATDGTS